MTKHQDPADLLPGAIQPGPKTEIAMLPPADRALVVLKSTQAEIDLKALIARTSAITAPPIDKAGREEVHRAAMDHKNARLAIEKGAKAATEDAKAFTKAVSAEEKRLIALNAEEEARLFKLRDDYDAAETARIAAEKAKEQARVDAIREKMDAIGALPMQSLNDTSAQLAETLADLKGFEVTFDDFAEFQDEAKSIIGVTIAQLETMHGQKVAAETAAAAARAAEEQLAAQRAELEKAQRELAEQKEAIARERAALEAAKKPKVDDTLLEFEVERKMSLAPAGEAAYFDPVGEMVPQAELPRGQSLGAGALFDRIASEVLPEPLRSMIVQPEAAPAELNMHAYYYGFEPTGVQEVDVILSAVAEAGKAFHHTDSWGDETAPRAPHTGTTAVSWIQNAAADLARYVTQLKAREEWLECLEAAGVDNWEGVAEASRIRREVV